MIHGILSSQIVAFGGDGDYKVWFVDDEDIEIPKHYKNVTFSQQKND